MLAQEFRHIKKSITSFNNFKIKYYYLIIIFYKSKKRVSLNPVT
jgi:hypothetical protein